MRRAFFCALFSGEQPDDVHQSGEVSEKGQQQVNPELQAEADFQKCPDGRNEHGNNDAKQFHVGSFEKGEYYAFPLPTFAVCFNPLSEKSLYFQVREW